MSGEWRTRMSERSRTSSPGVFDFVERRWEEDILPTLTRYIEIPAKSPAFDPEWAAHSHIARAVALIEDWSRRRPIEGLTVETVRLPGRTPLILLEVPGTSAETVLLYGHCDKQPEMVGWSDGLGPWIPVRRGERLYGRGGQDDGYAVFCALTAIEAVQRSGAPHARCVVLIEACEESGSRDLPAYMEALAARLGEPDLVICLDSGCGNYDPALGDDLAARDRQRRADRRGAERGRSLRRERDGAVELSHRAPAPLADRGRAHRGARQGLPGRDAAGAPRGSAGGGRHARRRARSVSGDAGREPREGGAGRGDDARHLGAGAVSPRRRRHPGGRGRRQRDPAEDVAEAVAAHPAHPRRGGGHAPSSG